MSPRAVIEKWIEGFNAADTDRVMELYAADASLHVVFAEPVEGREGIRGMFEAYFAMASLECITESLLESDDWAILEWRDPMGLRGCNLYQVKDGVIVRQRNYFDQLTFLRKNGLPIPDAS